MTPPVALLLLACKGGGDTDIVAEEGVVYVVPQDAMLEVDRGARVTLETLQGLLNRDGPRLFFRTDDGDQHDSTWQEALAADGLVFTEESEPLWYLAAFRDEVKGYVLFDSTKRASVTIAVTMAGLSNAVAIDIGSVDAHRFVVENEWSRLADVSDWTTDELIADASWETRDPSALVYQEEFSGPYAHPLDLGVARKYAFTYEDPREDPELAPVVAMLGQLDDDAIVYGWGYADANVPETEFVEVLSGAGFGISRSEQANNLSVLSAYPFTGSLAPASVPAAPEDRDHHYVAIVVVHGGTPNGVVNRLTDPEVGLWASPDRGQVPVAWAVDPAVADVAPYALAHLAATATDNDLFVAAPSGHGYLFPSRLPDRDAWAARVAERIAALGLSHVVVADRTDTQPNGWSLDVLEPLLAEPAVRGVVFLAAGGNSPEVGDVHWQEQTPALPATLWGFDGPAGDSVASLATTLAGRTRDSTRMDGYTLIVADAQRTTYANIRELAASLDPAVEIVRADVLFEMVKAAGAQD